MWLSYERTTTIFFFKHMGVGMMSLDSPEGMGVTADSRKVRPGMIYVDLSSRKNRKRIYEAYEKGASLIFTPFNISDPNLPVIKVESPHDTFYMLFDRLFKNRKDQAKLVGILGESDKCVLVELLQRIFEKKNVSKLMMDIIPITVDINSNSLLYLDMNFDSAILTDRGALESNYRNQPAQDFFSGLSDKKTIIINNDEYHGIKETEELAKIKFITYGLNKKAIVTASSIDIDEITCFNYCVQRSFQTRSGASIEPFEIPVRLNVLGSHNIYNALAVITCALYYDSDIEHIKETIESYKAPARHFQKIYDGDFAIIDNHCSSIHDYTAAFDSIQILSYKNLILIISVSQDSNPALHGEKARLLSEWVRILKCKEVILTSCMDGDSHIGELPIRNMKIYKKNFKENDIPFRYYHLLHHAIEKGLSIIGKNDLMVMLGSNEMSAAQKIVYRQLRLANETRN